MKIIREKLSVLILLLTISATCVVAATHNPYAKHKTIIVTSDIGDDMLQHSEAKNFIALMSSFITQQSLSHCGIASAVMVLNALEVEPPLSPTYAPYKFFTQDGIFYDEKLLDIVRPSQIQFSGITLNKLAELIRFYAVEVQTFHADSTDLNHFRSIAVDVLHHKNQAVIVNFCRRALGQSGCGHFSPLGGYNKKYDSFLILDVARYKNRPFWVKASDLYTAMSALDNKADNSSRGFLVITKN